MLISNEDAAKRLNSPMNLINSLKNKNGSRSKAMNLFVPSVKSVEKVEAPEKVEEIEQKTEQKVEVKSLIIDNESLIVFNPFNKPSIPSIPTKKELNPPSVDDLLRNSDAQIRLGLAHDSALEVLTASIAELKNKLPEIKANKLPQVIVATSKVVQSIRQERNEAAKLGKDREVHYHFYTPERKTIADYQVIDVTP